MPQATRVCRVCGKTYTACNTNRHFDGAFHWREVACSPECGHAYLKKITDARDEKPVEIEKPSLFGGLYQQPEEEE